jgi:hypothetical protein
MTSVCGRIVRPEEGSQMQITSVSELTTITFSVPTAIAEQARAEVTQVLDGIIATHAGHAGGPATASDHGSVFRILTPSEARSLGKSWSLPAWLLANDAERERGRWVIEHCTTQGRQVLRLFLEQPDRVDTEEIQKLLEVDAGSVPGILRAISAHCRRLDRRPCWHWIAPSDDPRGTGFIRLDEDLVEILTWGFDNPTG